MSLFSTLNTGVSGMSASRAALSTTSHNISNVNSDFYTRQRVTTSSNYSKDGPVNIGYGVNIDNVVRLHDEFVYSRLKTSSGNLEYSSFSKKNLEEIGQYFPDLQDVGLKKNLADYYNAWNDFSSNPKEGAQKTNLIAITETMTTNIKDTRDRIRTVQNSINDQLEINIDEVNRLGRQIANINLEITRMEVVKPTVANDLRDQRDELELTMAKLLNIEVFKGDTQSNSMIDTNIADNGRKYNLSIAGVSLVNGYTFSPLKISNEKNPAAFYNIYSEREDEIKTDLTTIISGGKIGAMLDLRGRNLDISANNGYPTDGVLQGYIDDMDTFAKTMIVNTNNIYAQSSQEQMVSSPNKELRNDTTLMGYDKNIQKGSFEVIVYDVNGNEVAKKTIDVNSSTSMDDTRLGNSIVGDFNESTDDNGDNDATNDVDDYFTASFKYDDTDRVGTLEFIPNGKEGYTIAIKDNGTNIPGVMGMSRFFSGNSAQNIDVESTLKSEPGKLQAFGAPISGNNDVSNKMVQLQYEKLDFYGRGPNPANETIEGFYRMVTSNISSNAEQMGLTHKTNQAIFTTVNQEFQSVSGVSLDEELADLMKFQTAYSSNAKILTTIDKMLDTLLSIK